MMSSSGKMYRLLQIYSHHFSGFSSWCLLSPLQKLVVDNVEVLTQMRTSFDKPDHMAALFKRLTCVYQLWNF